MLTNRVTRAETEMNMSRRKHYIRKQCAHPGCSESARYEYDTAREYRESSMHKREWKCTRHRAPEEVLAPSNLERETVLVCQQSGRYPELQKCFWNGTHGLVYGDGYKAYADDFPEGTKLIVTARIELPPTK